MTRRLIDTVAWGALAIGLVAPLAAVTLTNASVDLESVPPTVALEDLDDAFGAIEGRVWQVVAGSATRLVVSSWTEGSIVAELASAMPGDYVVAVLPAGAPQSQLALLTMTVPDPDADTLDGLDSEQFLRSDEPDRLTSGTLTTETGTTLDVEGALDASGATELILPPSGITGGGAGSGLDADTLDGVDSSELDTDEANELNTGLTLAGTDLRVTDAGGTLIADLGSLEQTMEEITPTTTRGDLLVEGEAEVVRLPVGRDAAVLVADSSTAEGIAWSDAPILYRLPALAAKTGQADCWDGSGTQVPCAETGQDGELQRGVGAPTPRFVDGGGGTVTDSLTGLTWLRDANCFGARSWPEALVDVDALADGTCGLDDGSVAGVWRLPNVRELTSLVDYGQSSPALPADHIFAAVQQSTYWTSSTHFALGTDDGWMVDLSDGGTRSGNKAEASFVWPIRIVVSRAPGACDPDGSYDLTGGPIHYDCCLGMVDLTIDQFIFVADGTTISSAPSSPVPLAGDATTCPDGVFSNASSISGDCTETYALEGSFTGADSWSGTYSMTFTGPLCGCFGTDPCTDQSFPVIATRQ